MGNRFSRIGLVGKAEDSRVADTMIALTEYLTRRGIEVLVASEVPLELPPTVRRVPEKELSSRPDLLVAIGGDGTMLYAAHLVLANQIPLLGINRGRLGFLTDVTPDDLEAGFDEVLAGNYGRESRLVLQAELISSGQPAQHHMALNDVVVTRWQSGRILDFETYIDGSYVNTHGADGVIVATATGSTAYALSSGGPIIQPELDVMELVPICPHTLSDRPIVIDGRSEVEVKVPAGPDSLAQITCDGRQFGELTPGDRLLIRAAPHRATMIHPPGHDYYKILRSKLHWGRSGHRRKNDETNE